MGQIVETFHHKTIEQMKQYYEREKINKTPPGAVFRAKTDYAVITAYRSGKVLFQGHAPEKEYEKWTNNNNLKQMNKQSVNSRIVTSSLYTPPQSLLNESHIGSDESGTGDYFGPVTTCAVYVTNKQINELEKLGIQDSKAITDQNVLSLSNELVNLNIPYSLLILHNEKYNSLQKQGWSQGKMKAMLHHHAIKNVVEKIESERFSGILIDQFCQPNVYLKYIESENESLLPHTFFMTKAESYSIAVAAASIIARASFLKEMDKLSEKIGFTLLKGASNKVDELIAQIIREKGESILQTCAKLHFANTEKGRKLV